MSETGVHRRDLAFKSTEPPEAKTSAALKTLPASRRDDEKLKLLARALGRQAARRHMHRGHSIVEVALALALGALIIAGLWYCGLLHSGWDQHP